MLTGSGGSGDGAEGGAGTMLAGDIGATALAGGGGTRLVGAAASPGPGGRPDAGLLQPGQAFGTRYRVVRLLGAGGMGAVYQAWDSELSVMVALKTIRPESAADQVLVKELEQRFKRELLIAREVTHKNVVRIHDLGEISGTKYITMSYVEGWSLSALLHDRGKLPVPEALRIARQVASGLEAAHDAGVVHRDLKPANIMVDAPGHALILDFGIAKIDSSEQKDGAGVPVGTGGGTHSGLMTEGTLSGTIAGTLEYMAPEQAQAKDVDRRADIYAFGLILRDLLVGLRPKGASPLDDLQARIEKGLPPLSAVDASLPATLEGLVTKCTEIDREARYQTMAEMNALLARLDDQGQLLPEPKRLTWRVVAAGVVLATGLTAGAAWLLRPAPPPVEHEPVSVLIADFENKAKEPLFDGIVEQALGVGLESTRFVTLYPRRDAIRLAAQIAPGARLDPEHATLVAVREGVMRLLIGSIERQSSGFKLTTQGLDPATSNVLFTFETRSATKDTMLDAVGQMAARIRRELGDRSAQISGESGKESFTAGSLEAAHAYAQGQELQWAGNLDQALASYQQAVKLDPTMGRALAGIGAVSNSLGRRQEAEMYYSQALQHLDRMTERERYRTRGGYYLLVRNDEKAREEAQALVDKFPADTAALANLAVAEFYRRDMKRSVELGRKALVAMPRNVIRASNLTLFLMYAGDFKAAEQQADFVIGLNPQFAKGYVAKAISQAASGRGDDAERTWRTLAPMPGAAAYYAASGLADLHMYQGRLAEAAKELEQAVAAEAKGSATRRARLLVTLAEVRAQQGRRRDAADLAKRALAASTDEGVQLMAGIVLAGAGQATAAESAAASLGEHLETEFQIYARVVEGEIALSRSSPREALAKFQAAQKIADTWLGRFGLARTYLAAVSPAEADSEIGACLKRQGEATAVLLDDVPSIRLVALLPYYQGRIREALKDTGAAESYKAFLAIKANGDEQGLVADARRRLEKR